MASIYKRKKSDRNAPWYIAYTDEHGRRRVEKGCTDRKATEGIARQLETDAAKRKRGVITADETRYAEQNRRLLTVHVAEYLAACEHEGQSPVHIANKKTQLARLVKYTNATRLSDLHADSVGAYLESLRKAGKSARTVNQHRNTAVSFLQWCANRGRLPLNPLRGKLETLDERQDRRRVRRAMAADELAALLSIAPARRTVYLTAAATGLRRSELAGLRWCDVDFDAGTLTVGADVSKSGREDSIPLHPDAAAALAEHKPEDAKPAALVFRTIPRVRTFHADCARARAAWIDAAKDDAAETERRERSDFLARFDGEGRQLDLHGLRTTLGTMLARSGATPQVARMVMRHSDVRITMKHYTDLRLHDAAAAVAMLPRLAEPDEPDAAEDAELRATGTDDTSACIMHKLAEDCSACDSAHVAQRCNSEHEDAPDLRLSGALVDNPESGYNARNFGTSHGVASSRNVLRNTNIKVPKHGAIGAVG